MIFKKTLGDIQKQCIPNSSFSTCAMSEKKKKKRAGAGGGRDSVLI